MMVRSYCLGAALALLLVLSGCAAPAEAAEGGGGQAADSAPAWEELALERTAWTSSTPTSSPWTSTRGATP